MATTIKDIAEKTGLGLATISKYLNGGNVRPENRTAIESAVKDLNYSVNEAARSLKSKRSYAIGVVLPEINNQFFMQILTEMEYVFKKKNYVIIISDSRDDEALEAESVRFLMNKGVAGIISFPVGRNGRYLKPALAEDIPVMFIDRTIPDLKGKVDSVIIDNVAISREATSFLVKNGHRSIGIITGPENAYTADRRLQGYREILEENGIPVRPEHIIHADFTVEGGMNGLKKLLKNGKGLTAIYAVNHAVTLGALMGIRAKGLKVPDDLSLIGFDSMDWAKINVPALTIVEQPIKSIGRQAAELFIKRLDNENGGMPKQSIILSATLNIGESVRKIS
ncbi:MAG: LacI family transcriptional regulator [Clostridiales Family XIII bacterium]|jgi:LacI family transcriptional regulator|nr:LacI family transcriptional regulator [Clostridiales Family XIII bacterium]